MGDRLAEHEAKKRSQRGGINENVDKIPEEGGTRQPVIYKEAPVEWFGTLAGAFFVLSSEQKRDVLWLSYPLRTGYR